MNWEQIEGNWTMYRGKIKERWGKLTDNDLDVISGKRDQLSGYLQKTYGVIKEDAEHQIAKFLSKISGDDTGKKSTKSVGKKHSGEEQMDSEYDLTRKAG